VPGRHPTRGGGLDQLVFYLPDAVDADVLDTVDRCQIGMASSVPDRSWHFGASPSELGAGRPGALA
jgi:hypothetical protein